MKNISHSVWPMLLITFLTLVFFIAGVFLELEAAGHGLKKLSQNFSNNSELLKEALNFQTERIARIHQAAATAFDIAKISLGALVAMLTQHMSNNQKE